MKVKDESEWILQAEYDLKAAQINFKSGLYPYSVFLCHLSLEKAFKAVYYKKTGNKPPKIHDLLALEKILNLEPPEHIESFIRSFSAVSVRARYPEDLKASLKEFDKKKTNGVLIETRKAVKWLKEQ